MSHPYEQHKDHLVQRRRVGDIAKGHASGGAVARHDDAAADRKLINKVIDERDAMGVTGKPASQRLDRPGRARGGRAPKHKGTNVNVIVAPQAGHPAVPAVGGPGAMPSPVAPVVPPRPPGVVPPPGGAAPMPPPMGGPPGAPPIRRSGGRAYATGGAVKSGPAYDAGKSAGTPVQHSGNKLDGANIGRGPVITRKTGGPVEHPATGGMAPKLPGGSHGGLARLAKAKRAARG